MTTKSEPSIANRVRWALVSAGMSQSDFAKRSGISPGFISEVIRGVKNPGLELLRALKQELGVSLDWLVTGTGDMYGKGPIDRERFNLIRLELGLAREAVLMDNRAARELMGLLPEMPLERARVDDRFGRVLANVGVDMELLGLILALYNAHLSASDPASLSRDVLAFAKAHYEEKRAQNGSAQIA